MGVGLLATIAFPERARPGWAQAADPAAKDGGGSKPRELDEPSEELRPEGKPPASIADHRAGQGVTLVQGATGELVFSAYITIRYLNQLALDKTFTNDAGERFALDRRDDMQFQKVLLYFKGWLARPEFRYLTYVWTSNASQGLGAQVVVAGNLTYKLGEALALGAGIGGLPTTRSTRGTFPRWLKQDSRTVADDYFRGSYTTGVWAWGDLTEALHYHAMIGNNLSQLGVDAGQLGTGLNTYSGALWWTTGTFDAYEGYGDVEGHQRPSTTFGVAFTQSREDAEEQAGTNNPENSQIRLSDGRLLFADGTFAPGVRIRQATYRMAAVDGAIKYRGFSLAGEAYYRWVDDFHSIGATPVKRLRDGGFQVQGSGMVIPKYLMVYGYGSKVFGEYGNPWDLGGGVNYYVFGNRVLRANAEAIWVARSPVGNLSSPLTVGANGLVFVANLELLY